MTEFANFVPSPFIGHAAPIVFQLRRQVDTPLVALIAAAGLSRHTTDEVRAETLAACRWMYRGEVRRSSIRRLRGMWATIDRGEALPPEDADALADLGASLASVWPRLADMCLANDQFGPAVLRVSVAAAVWDWRNLPFAALRDGPTIALPLVEQLELHLRSLGSAGALAWAELAEQASRRFGMAPPIETTPTEERRVR